MKISTPHLSIILLLTTFFLSAQSKSKPMVSEMDPKKSILRNTEDSQNHKTLLAAMKGSDLEEALEFDGPFTVFAPSDKAFEKLPSTTLSTLLKPENKKQLHNVMTYHIVAGNLSASKMLKAMSRGGGKAQFTTVQGNHITATMQGIDIILTDSSGNSAKIITADSNQCNGIIHEIDSVILPEKL